MNIATFAPTRTTMLNAASRLGGCLLASMLLAGCGMNSSLSTATTSSTNPLLTMQGKVFGGQQPVVGATIQLYTVSTSTVAGASTALITGPTVTSLAGGAFNITGDYSCTSATQVYITATGGNSGSGTNSSLSLMTALGPCSALTSTTFININELTTVAAVYSLAPYMTDYLHVGSTSTGTNGLTNAMKTANLLVNVANGGVIAAPPGVTLPTATLNTLGNIIASCVNTTGSGSPACNSLFGATGASDSADAALYFAKHPASAALTALYSLGSSTAPFQPSLTSQPNDFTLTVKYTGNELFSPYGIAIDASGNAWVTNESGRSIVKAPALSSTFATTTFTLGGLLAPRGISIDRSGNLWIANTGGNTVVELSSSGTLLSGGGYTGGGISAPVAIANDSAGNAWVANFSGNSVTELSTTGTASGASPITGSSALSYPTSLALDSTGRVLVGNSGTGQLCIFSNAAALQSCITDGSLFGSTGVAVNASGSVAMSGSTTGSAVAGAFTLATNTGTVIANSPGAGGGLVLPSAVAYDGAGNTFFANSASLSEFSALNAVSASTGFGTLSTPEGIAVDASGNVWTANAGDNSISIFIGLGSPVVTPLAANVGP
jgi:streptogramin lyase